jgi:hypothetical protein
LDKVGEAVDQAGRDVEGACVERSAPGQLARDDRHHVKRLLDFPTEFTFEIAGRGDDHLQPLEGLGRSQCCVCRFWCDLFRFCQHLFECRVDRS